MKKLICLLCTATICLAFIGCSYEQTNKPTQDEKDEDLVLESTNEETEIKITPISADWPYYSTVDSLVLASSNVFEGKITDIRFDVIDLKTGEFASKDTKASSMFLYTIYEVEVSNSYKGICTSKVYIKIIGGMKGYKEADQLTKMKEFGIYNEKNGIMVLSNIESLDIGKSYMFITTGQIGDCHSIINSEQFAYDITGEEKTNTFGYNEIKACLTNSAALSD